MSENANISNPHKYTMKAQSLLFAFNYKIEFK